MRNFHAEPQPWMNQAECRQVPDASIFFPNPGESVKAAKDVCFRCVVLEECREYVLKLPHDTVGIYAGTTHRDRRAMFRRDYLRESIYESNSF